MIDRKVYVECRGGGSHDVRELAVLVPMHPRHDLAMMCERAGIPLPARPEAYREALQRGFGVEDSLTTVSGRDGRRKVRQKAPAPLSRRASDGAWVLHGLRCPNCGPVAPVAVAVVAAYAATFGADERVAVDVSAY